MTIGMSGCGASAAHSGAPPVRVLAATGMLWVALCGVAAAQVLPEGANGIAARYPGDVGIGGDPAVIFADDFESYSSASGLTSRWNEVYQWSNVRIATEAGSAFRGSKALEFAVPRQTSEVSNTATKYVSPKRDTLFVRYYAKFDPGFNVLGSSHNGGWISASYCCPGVRADGYNKFLVSAEFWRDSTSTPNPGQLNVYVYHPEQRDAYGDHFFPTGRVIPFDRTPGNFGSSFVARPDFVPELGRWYSYELMVKANTPGARDGRVAVWVDGRLVADWPNLRLRDTSALQIDRFTLDLHVMSNPSGVARKWYDNVVAATSYIGPVASGSATTKPSPPTDLVAR